MLKALIRTFITQSQNMTTSVICTENFLCDFIGYITFRRTR